MTEYTKDEAITFIEATRLTLEGKVGFKWLVEKLAGLRDYVETIADENELLNAFVDESGDRDRFDAFVATRSDAT